MNNIVKNKILPNNYRFKPIKLSGKIVNPKRDWNILIISFVVLILASIGFDSYMYWQIVNGDMYISVKKEELVIENLKSGDLQKISDIFDGKKSKTATLKLGNLVDPSI